MNNITYNTYSLGCKVNSYDSNKLAKQIEARGIRRADANADFVIIHTCSVTESAISKNRQMIKKARRENPGAKIILAGCWPIVSKIGKKNIDVDLLIEQEVTNEFWDFIEKEKLPKIRNEVILSEISKARYFIKVQDGCEQFCSYCIIPYARGQLKSRDKKDILDELKPAILKGYKEIVISGIHLGLYGHGSDYKLFNLLKDILKLPNLGRIRLSSIEVNEVNDNIINLIKDNPKFCKHLHIPLQSGCDKILKLMNRPYDTQEFRIKIKKIREAIPDIAISTDVIVGFPSESDQDFEATKQFINEMAFSKLHVFSFSAHKRTPAFSMSGQIKREHIAKRAKVLRELSVVLEGVYKNKFKGKKLSVVLENFKKGRAKMKTQYYFDIDCKRREFRDEDVGQFKEIEFNDSLN